MASLENPYEKVRPKMVAARRELMKQLAKFSKDELKKQPAGDEWSPLQIAHHLYIADGLALEQMQLVQTEDNPLIIATENETPRLTRASEPPASLDAVLAGMAARREELFGEPAIFATAASGRPFLPPEMGEGKFHQLADFLPGQRPMASTETAN